MIPKAFTMNDLINPAISSTRPVIFHPYLTAGLTVSVLILRAFINLRFDFDLKIIRVSINRE